MVGPRGIVTPEAVVLEFETAGVASRLLAALIDLAIQAAALFALLMLLAGAAAAGASLGGAAAALVYFGMFAIIFVYPAAFETLWRGRTPGKAALGLRVVTIEGGPIRFRHAALRSILGLVEKMLSQGVIGILAILFSRRNQRLGDLLAGTIVLRERKGARAPTPVTFAPPPGLEAYTSTLDVSGLGHDEYGTIRSFLLRAATMAPASRFDLARSLAEPMVVRLRTVPPPGVGPDAFLACVAAAFQGHAVAATVGRPTGAPTAFRSVWGTTAASSVRYLDDDGSAAPPETPVPAGGFAAPD